MAKRLGNAPTKSSDREKTNTARSTGVGCYAIYARCASSEGSSESIENQVFECTEYAKKKLWRIAEEFILVDIAVSGSSLVGRRMLRRLMAAAERRPRPFNRLLIADTPRLTRNMEDYLYILKHFRDHDIRIVDISQR